MLEARARPLGQPLWLHRGGNEGIEDRSKPREASLRLQGARACAMGSLDMLHRLGCWDRNALIRRRFGNVNRPTVLEFLANTLVCALVIGPTFFALSPRNEALAHSGAPLWMPLTAADALIPLVPEFIWVYALFYPAFFVVALSTTADRRVMYQGVIGYVVTALIALTCFALMPSRMEQPTLSGCLTTSCAALRWMYAFDGGHHIFPSLHVAYPVCTLCLLKRTMPRFIWMPFLLVVLGIAASTLLLKRHALVDVPAGALTGIIGWLVGTATGERVAGVTRRFLC